MFDKMDLTLTVLIQVCIMLILIAVGFLTYKAKLMNETGQKQHSNLLLYIVMPAVIINAYRKEFQADLLSGLLWSFALAFVSHFIARSIVESICQLGGKTIVTITIVVHVCGNSRNGPHHSNTAQNHRKK